MREWLGGVYWGCSGRKAALCNSRSDLAGFRPSLPLPCMQLCPASGPPCWTPLHTHTNIYQREHYTVPNPNPALYSQPCTYTVEHHSTSIHEQSVLLFFLLSSVANSNHKARALSPQHWHKNTTTRPHLLDSYPGHTHWMNHHPNNICTAVILRSIDWVEEGWLVQ